MTGGQSHAVLVPGEQPPTPPAAERLTHGPEPDADDARRRLRHDIKHELATISLLAALIGTADDIGGSSRVRATQLLREARWLDDLFQAYDDDPVGLTTMSSPSPSAERVRVDALTAEVVATLGLTHPTRVQVVTSETWTYADRLALWRALRNVLDNAFRAAGPRGRVHVRVTVEGAWVVVQIDDDGPGFGAGPAGLASLGLSIVRDILAEYGGSLATASGDPGGARVRLLLPAIDVPADGWVGEDDGADPDL